jgi:hypothetical protein
MLARVKKAPSRKFGEAGAEVTKNMLADRDGESLIGREIDAEQEGMASNANKLFPKLMTVVKLFSTEDTALQSYFQAKALRWAFQDMGSFAPSACGSS